MRVSSLAVACMDTIILSRHAPHTAHVKVTCLIPRIDGFLVFVHLTRELVQIASSKLQLITYIVLTMPTL